MTASYSTASASEICKNIVLAVLLAALAWPAAARALSPAFYYGPSPFPQALRVFDTWVVEPDNLAADPAFIRAHRETLYAYVSIGEVDAHRPYLADMPKAWLRGDNPIWKSRVIDQSAPGWPAFFVDSIVGPLRAQGYRHFFIDTLDSYHLIATTPEARQAQERGLVEAIRLLKARYPDSRLIVNRGFEILPRIRDQVSAVVAESLFQSWDNANGRYVAVSDSDRAWLLGQLAHVRDVYKLPVIVIDYAPAGQREQARGLARRIESAGFTPWVADGSLAHVGTGAVDPVPRKVLMLYDEIAGDDPLKNSDIHRYAAMPLNYLGYVPEYRNIATDGLPDEPLAGRYAGIVSWMHASENAQSAKLGKWLKAQIDDGVPVAILGYFGFPFDSITARRLGLKYAATSTRGPVTVDVRKPAAAFESEPVAQTEEFFPLTAEAPADVWLRTRAGKQTQDAVAITRWGGYALAPFVVSSIKLHDKISARWVIDPIGFFQRALKLPDMPTPDVTTENGRRLLLVHIDGDGFASKAEFPGAPWAADVLLREILQRYDVPTTVSVIEGEIAPTGMYPKFVSQLEPIARKIFALPRVEAASHSFSHPFKWRALARDSTKESDTDGEHYNLDIPGYDYDPAREIDGSVRYVDTLLPKGKRCRTFLWTGDCSPGPDALARIEKAGLLNMNGGDTTITRTNATLTAVAPLGLLRSKYFQVYAPNQNENLYTNLWTGPFYGFERVIETFEMTERPLRLKPVNIYYHTYSASKPASLSALRRVYDWALAQPLHPVFASTYIRKVLDFNTLAIAREGQGWSISGGSDVRTMRLPKSMGYPDLARSRNVLGWWDEADVRYVHLAGAAHSHLVLRANPGQGPRIARANGRIEGTSTGWTITAHRPIDVELGGVEGCRITQNGKPVRGARENGLTRIRSAARSARFEVHCGR